MKKGSFTIFNIREDGFSLVELSAIIAIAATLAIGYISWTMPATQNDAIKTLSTYQRMQTLSHAIENFVAVNQKLPCPANPTLNSQMHQNSNSSTANLYDFDDEALTIDDTGIRCPVSIGAIPTRALGLPSDYMFDGWNRKFLYHVAPDLCSNTICNTRSYKAGITTATGGLTVTGDTVLADNTAAFVLLSYGTNGKGAYLPSGSSIPSDNVSDDEADNNDNNYTLNNGNNSYIKRDISSDFDDIVLFRTQQQIESLIDAVTAADFLTCRDNSVALSTINRSVADTLRSSVTTLEIKDGSTVYNTGDAAILEVMWNLQEACSELYGGTLPSMCPAGMAYNSDSNDCTCLTGKWDEDECSP